MDSGDKLKRRFVSKISQMRDIDHEEYHNF